MKRLTLFLLASVIVAIPIILLVKKVKETDESRRYDIDDYVTEEGL